MKDGKHGDVLIVSSFFSTSADLPSICHLISNPHNLQVAHGLILRCFLKRWLSLPLDTPVSLTMEPGAIAVLT